MPQNNANADAAFPTGGASWLAATINAFAKGLIQDIAAKISDSRKVDTQHSLTGGGALSADRTLSLVGDAASPGASRYYGTNAASEKGYHVLPTGGTGSLGTALTSLNGLGIATDKLAYGSATDTYLLTDFPAQARTFLAAATIAAQKAALDLEPGVDVQPYSVLLAALAGETIAADQLIYGVGANNFDVTAFTSTGRAVAGAASQAAARAAIGSELEMLPIFIETPTNKTYTLIEKSAYALTVNTLARKTASGSITSKLQINGVDITGLTALAGTSTQAETSATAANSLPVGGRLTLVTSANASAADLAAVVKMTR